MADKAGFVIVTGAEGFIGRAVVERLMRRYDVVGLDQKLSGAPPGGVRYLDVDLTSDASVRSGLDTIRDLHRNRVASVIHLAAYFDLTGEPNPKYEQVTLRGTERLLRELSARFIVEQFVFASTMLVHKPVRPGERIDEDAPLEARLPYRVSKIETEKLLREQHGDVPVVFLRPGGVYDDRGSNPFLAHQIARIYEKRLKGRLYSGDLATGQAFVHLEDLVDAIERIVDRRARLSREVAILVGEPRTLGYGKLQDEIGRLIHSRDWETLRIPEPIAKAGAVLQEEVVGDDPFVKPWMVENANEHYALDIGRARSLLGWKPRHRLAESLKTIVANLEHDPVAWYRANKLDAAVVAGRVVASVKDKAPDDTAMREHMAQMESMRLQMLWVHWIVIALGAWLATSPFQLALFDPGSITMARDVTAERNLWPPEVRNALTGWNDLASGALLMLFGALSLSRRFPWAPWGSAVVGLWLLFAPLVFWTPSAAAYMNDTIVGVFAIAMPVLVAMMPGMSHEGMMDASVVPAGWTYSPSEWLQRLPMIVLGFFGFLIARYLAAYQLGHIDHVWEPFFQGTAGRNGTEHIITSAVSRAWPIADAGLGATAYLLEALMGAMGDASRWRTMPWMVTFFFILVVPLGAVSIFFIVIQPIAIGTWCTLCLIAAAAMLLMIPLAVDEVLAMGQYVLQSRRAGRPLLRTFFQGGPSPEAARGKTTALDASPFAQWVASVRGVTIPWTLAASCVIGAWLMFSRPVFGTIATFADSDHLVGAMVVTVAVIAMAEVARALRFINVAFGLWLVVAPWLLFGGSLAAAANDVIAGMLLIGLALPRGKRSRETYGSWDAYVV